MALWAEAGSVFFTRSRSLLGRAIRWAESDPEETNHVWANHTGVVTARGWLVPPDSRDDIVLAIVIEALGTVRRQRWWEAHGKERQEIRVFRPVPPLALPEVMDLLRAADKFVGDRYGWWKLLFHLGDRALFRGRKVLSSLLRLDNRPICSYLAAKSFDEAGRTFGMAPQAADPDEMLDYCLAHPDEWQEVLPV
jgi:hypothetical protein